MHILHFFNLKGGAILYLFMLIIFDTHIFYLILSTLVVKAKKGESVDLLHDHAPNFDFDKQFRLLIIYFKCVGT